eukprot:COSAG03_NODE_17209_length_381_cov_0.737589_1_plen_77_part_10
MQVTCVARNAPKANFLTTVSGGVTVKQARAEIQKIFEKVQSSTVTLTSYVARRALSLRVAVPLRLSHRTAPWAPACG